MNPRMNWQQIQAEATVDSIVKQKGLNATDEHGDTPLLWAVSSGFDKTAELLIKAGSALEEKNNAGKTALEIAIESNNFPVACVLLVHGAVSRDINKLYQLLKSHGQLDGPVLERLRAHIALDLLLKPEYQEFLEFCKNQHISWLQNLLRETDFRDYETAEKIINFMTKMHFSLDAKDNEGYTLLDRAIQNKHLPVVYALIHHGATIPQQLFDYLKTCDQGDPRVLEITRKLCEQQHPLREEKQRPSSSRALSDEAFTEVIDFCINQHLRWFEQRCEGEYEEEDNDDKNIIDSLKTVTWLSDEKKQNLFNDILIQAVTSRNEHIIQLLIEAHIELDAENNEDTTALLIAASKGYDKVVAQLLDAGVKLERDKGDTALDKAIHAKHLSTVSLLLRRGAKIQDPKPLFEFLKSSFYDNGLIFLQALEPLRALCKQLEERAVQGSGESQAIIEYCQRAHMLCLETVAKRGRIQDDEIKSMLDFVDNAKELSHQASALKRAWLNTAVDNQSVSMVCILLRHGLEISDPRAMYGMLKSLQSPLSLQALEIYRVLCEEQARYQEKGKELVESPLFLTAEEYKNARANGVAQHDLWLGNIINHKLSLPEERKKEAKVILQWLIEQGYDGYLRLIEAAREGHEEMVALLLEFHVSPDKVLDNGDSALLWAAWEGHDAIVERLLVVKDVKLEYKNKKGKTALVEAIDGFNSKLNREIGEIYPTFGDLFFLLPDDVQKNEVVTKAIKKIGDKFLSIVCALLRRGAMIPKPQTFLEFLKKLNQSDSRVLFAFQKLYEQQNTLRQLPEAKNEPIRLRLSDDEFELVAGYYSKLKALTEKVLETVTTSFAAKTPLPAVLATVVKEYYAEEDVISPVFGGNKQVFFKPENIETLYESEFAPKAAPAVKPS